MKKILSLLFLSFAFVVVAATTSFAVYTPVSYSTRTAYINLTSQGVFQSSIMIYNVSNNTAVSSITWTNVTLGVTGWATAAQYVRIQSTMTQSGICGIQIYTNNKVGTTYRYTGISTIAVAGLVNASSTTQNPLPMAWTVKTSTVANVAYNTTGATTITVNPEATGAAIGGVGASTIAFSSIWLKDKGNTGGSDPFVNAEEYITIIKKNPGGNSGIKYGGSNNERGGDVNGFFYVYLGAKFSTAEAASYGTDTLIFEMYTE